MGPISETALQRAIARHYRLTVTALKPQGGIWKAFTSQGCYIAKPMGRPPDELEELTRQLRRIQENGFREVALPVPTVDGKTFFDCGGRNYILTPFINGPAPSFSNVKHLERAAALYARFHLAAAAAPPGGAVSLKTWVAEYSARCQFLANCLAALSQSSRLNRIDRAVQRWGRYYLRQAEYCRAGLAREDRALPQAPPTGAAEFPAPQHPGGFCHNDPAPRNIIMQEPKWFLIDFELAGGNLFIKELATLILRALALNTWQAEIAARLLEAYAKIRPPGGAELAILPFFLCFPQKFWRFCSQRYHEKLERGEHFYQEKIWSLTQEEALRRRALRVWAADFGNADEEEDNVRIEPG